jgi:hypothetical protein
LPRARHLFIPTRGIKYKRKKKKEKKLSTFNNFMRETATRQLEREKTTTQ